MLVLQQRTYGRTNERANECPAEQKDDRNDRRTNEQADGRSIFVCVCMCTWTLHMNNLTRNCAYALSPCDLVHTHEYTSTCMLGPWAQDETLIRKHCIHQTNCECNLMGMWAQGPVVVRNYEDTLMTETTTKAPPIINNNNIQSQCQTLTTTARREKVLQ